jgi:hypothetical protein
MGECIFYFLKEKIVFKTLLIKSKIRVPWKNKVDTYEAPVFAPDFSTNVLAAQMCANFYDHSMSIRFLCCDH